MAEVSLFAALASLAAQMWPCIAHNRILRVARNFQLRLSMRHAERPRVTFDGFKRDVRAFM